MSTKFLIIGDLHLEKLEQVLSGLDHIALQLQTLHDASNYALEHGIKRVVLLGDIFETPHPEQRTVRQFLEVLNSYPRLEYHMIRGNHDYDNIRANSLELVDFISELRALSHVNLYLSPTELEWGGVRLCFLSYPYLKPTGSDRSRPRLLFGHHEIAGAQRDNGMVIRKEEAHLRVRTNTKDYWIVGHLHRHQQGTRYFYPGTMQQMNFGEPLPKGFAVVRASEKNGVLTVKPEFIEYKPPFQLINLPVSSPDDLKKIKNKQTRRYKVILTEGVELPLGWRNKYPNVIKVAGAKGKQELDQELAGQIPLVDQAVNSIDITRNLSGFLKQRGFDRDTRKRGKDKVVRILAEKKR